MISSEIQTYAIHSEQNQSSNHDQSDHPFLGKIEEFSQENQNDSAKYLILLGSRVQKLGNTGFGVELERPESKAERAVSKKQR